jgi:hypothetical protein
MLGYRDTFAGLEFQGERTIRTHTFAKDILELSADMGVVAII